MACEDSSQMFLAVSVPSRVFRCIASYFIFDILRYRYFNTLLLDLSMAGSLLVEDRSYRYSQMVFILLFINSAIYQKTKRKNVK